MRLYRLFGMLALSGTTLFAGSPPDSGNGAAQFAKMKSLIGVWNGKDKDGNPVQASYKLVSAGKSVIETLDMGDSKENMVTLYHLDGGQLMMTHYCSIGNQPRMRADRSPQRENTLTFNFVDATNITSLDDARMQKLVLTFRDNNHFTQEWTLRAKGEDQAPYLLRYERAK